MKRLLLGLKFIIVFISKPSISYFEVIQKVCLKELDKHPNDLFVMMFLADHYAQYKKYDEAQVLLESLLDKGANNKEVILLLSKVYFNLHQYDRVERLLSQFDMLSDKDIANYYLGYSLIELGKRKEGIEYLSIYVKYHSKDWKVWSLLGFQYFKEEIYDMALDSYIEADKLNPDKKEIRSSIELCKDKLKSRIGQC